MDFVSLKFSHHTKGIFARTDELSAYKTCSAGTSHQRKVNLIQMSSFYNHFCIKILFFFRSVNSKLGELEWVQVESCSFFCFFLFRCWYFLGQQKRPTGFFILHRQFALVINQRKDIHYSLASLRLRRTISAQNQSDRDAK